MNTEWKQVAADRHELQSIHNSYHHVIVMVFEVWYVCFDFMAQIAKLAPTHSSPPLIATTYKKNAAIELFFKSTYFLEILGSKVIYLL